MAATIPTPDARRVRRWLSRALAVSGGAVAATAIVWGVGATSASAAENPLDVGGENPASGVPVVSESESEPVDVRSADAPSNKSADAPTTPAGGQDHGGHVGEAPREAGPAEGPEPTADPLGGRLADRGDATDVPDCAEHMDGPTDVRGLFEHAQADRVDINRFGADASGADASGASASEQADPARVSDTARGTCPDVESERPEESGEQGLGQHATSGTKDDSGDTRDRVEQAWHRHVAEQTRGVIDGVGETLHTVATLDGWSGDRTADWSEFDLPWAGLTPDPAELPSPYDVPMGQDGPGVDQESPRASQYAAGAGAPDHQRQHSVTSAADNNGSETSDSLDGASIDGAAVDSDSGDPATPPAPDSDPQKNVPAAVPSHSSIAGSAHADTLSGAVVTTADPFAVAAGGAVLRSGLLHKSMSPGSQPGVTPD